MRPSNFTLAHRDVRHAGCGGPVHVTAEQPQCGKCGRVLTDASEYLNPQVQHEIERRVFPTGTGNWWG